MTETTASTAGEVAADTQTKFESIAKTLYSAYGGALFLASQAKKTLGFVLETTEFSAMIVLGLLAKGRTASGKAAYRVTSIHEAVREKGNSKCLLADIMGHRSIQHNLPQTARRIVCGSGKGTGQRDGSPAWSRRSEQSHMDAVIGF